MTQVFITTGTGYIGSAIARLAKKKGFDVSALARSDAAAAQLQEHGIKPVRGDLKQPQSYLEAVKNADIVIHAGATNDADYSRIDEEVTDNILETLKGTNKTFVYTSGTWVLGNTPGDQSFNEDTTPNPINLVTWRVAVEKKVRQAAQQGLRTVVIRPSAVYGNNGGAIGNLYKEAARTGVVRYVGDGNNRWSLVHVDDLAELYLLAAQKAPAGSLYHAADNSPIKLREIAELVAKTAGQGVPARIQSWPVEEARKELGGFADGYLVDQNIDSLKARKELGWEPKAAKLPEELAKQNRELAGTRS